MITSSQESQLKRKKKETKFYNSQVQKQTNSSHYPNMFGFKMQKNCLHDTCYHTLNIFNGFGIKS